MSEMFVVIKNMPKVETQKKSDLDTICPFKAMEIGDGFVMPAIDVNPSRRHNIYYSAKRAGISILARIQEDGSLHVWRVA